MKTLFGATVGLIVGVSMACYIIANDTDFYEGIKKIYYKW